MNEKDRQNTHEETEMLRGERGEVIPEKNEMTQTEIDEIDPDHVREEMTDAIEIISMIVEIDMIVEIEEIMIREVLETKNATIETKMWTSQNMIGESVA
jgi:hypothetical protein